MNGAGAPAPPRLTVVAVDPGTAKCGVAVVRGPGAEILWREVVPADAVAARVCSLAAEHAASVVLVGDATAGRAMQDALAAALPPSVPVAGVPEKFTSQRARERYLRENPPRSAFGRLLPLGLRTPDRPYDDYVAVLLAEDYLKNAEKHRG